MQFRVVLPVILLSLLLVAPDAVAAKQSCKAPKVPVTVGKRTTCQSLAKAFPKPKSLDVRLFYLQRAFASNPAKAAGGTNRKRAQKKLLKALPRVLAHIDRRQAKAGAAAFAADRAVASAACQAGVGGPSAKVGGVTVSISGPNGAVLETDSGNLTVKLRYGVCGSSRFAVPECPTATGAVDASSSSSGEVVIEVWEGDRRLVSRSRTQFESKAKAKGKVGPDAKLQHIDLEYVHEVFIVASGGVVERGRSERKVRIKMPGGTYDAAGAQAKVSGDAGAVAKDGFEGVAKEAIDGYRRTEPGWSSFDRKPHCAELVSSPASGTLKLRKGNSGQLGLSAKAKTGGTASEARWTLLGAENAEFSPGSAEGASPSFSYKVTNAPQGGFIKVTVKFTSTAGVGEGSWTQPTEQGSIDTIAGTFDQRLEQSGSVLEWTGNVTFERSTPGDFGGPNGLFDVTPGTYTVTASGNGMLLGAPMCSMSGSGQFPLGPLGSIFVFGTPPTLTAPYEYSFSFGSNEVPMLPITLSGCPPEAEELEGTYEWAVAFSFDGGGVSEDGTSYTGSEEESGGGFSRVSTWSFVGTE
jgi:hypothetical protein